jgi:hypothetical protein
VIKALGDSDLYDSFLEAAAIQSQLEPKVIPISSWKKWRVALPIATAAALAGVLTVSQIIQSGRGPEPLRMVRNAAWLHEAKQNGAKEKLGADWNRLAWAAQRSGNSTALSPRGAAVRAGVLQVNLNVAVVTKEDATVTQTRAELRRVLSSVPGGGPAAAQADAASIGALNKTVGQLFDDSPWYRLGIWLGQARLAALAQDVLFFAPNADGVRALTDVHDRLATELADKNDVNAMAVLGQINLLLTQINNDQFTTVDALSNSLQSLTLAATSQ